MHYSSFLFLSFLLFLTACAQTELASHIAKHALPGQPAQEGLFKVGRPYTVEGEIYTPRETYNFTETGIASWYGNEFHGKSTANGEIFDKNELTAAHRTLQMPSLVRVTNLENGRSLIVRVNDRGPFKRGRVMDVSQRAAELLGFRSKGTARVRLNLLSEESQNIAMAARRGEDTRGIEVALNEPHLHKPQPSTYPETVKVAALEPLTPDNLNAPPIVPGHVSRQGNFMPDPVVSQFPVVPTSLYVQTGSFGDQANAMRLAQSLQEYGARVYPAIVNGRQFYRVRVGPVQAVEQADRLLGQVINSGNPHAIIVVE